MASCLTEIPLADKFIFTNFNKTKKKSLPPWCRNLQVAIPKNIFLRMAWGNWLFLIFIDTEILKTKDEHLKFISTKKSFNG